jgi:XTP/dITP diphosphohydrolase
MELWIATTNKNKLSEIKAEFNEITAQYPDLILKGLSDLPTYSQPPETGKTYLENARIKAKSLKAMKPGCWILAEDSGIESNGLGGLPGVHSARYAGEKASDMENTFKLLKMLQLKSTDRSAQFQCFVVAYSPDGTEHQFQGTLRGTLAPALKGQHGFGYDPIFIPEGQTQTLAELGPGFKRQHSHRHLAMVQFCATLKQHYRPNP